MSVTRHVVALALAATASGFVLQNEHVVAHFNTDPKNTGPGYGALTYFASTKGKNLLRADSGALWQVLIADVKGEQETISSTEVDFAKCTYTNTTEGLTLVYNNVAPRYVMGKITKVEIVIQLKGESLSFVPTFYGDQLLTLMTWKIMIPDVALAFSSKVLENYGFGIIHNCGPTGAETGRDGSILSTPACVYQGPTAGYIPMCPGGGTTNCPSYVTLDEAKSSCDSDDKCTGITYSAGGYQLRGGTDVEPSQMGEQSWLITNFAVCHAGSKLPVQCGNFGGDYPARSYQYMASYDVATPYSGLYLAAHDAKAFTKGFHATVSSAYPATVQFDVSSYVPDSTKPLLKHTSPYPVVLAVFDGDWYDSAMIYRNWVLDVADWTKQGPISQRTDIPAWLNNVTTWVNSHWQANDVFNKTGGDPPVVQKRVLDVRQRFALGSGENVGLHWYEWDTLGYKYGSDYSDCDPTDPTCGFDTHYPDYFPVRKGFSSALSAMQANGVRVVPYINGRIFDIEIKKWNEDQATRFMAKQLGSPKMNITSSDLSNYEESYGSGAVFNVACPHTQYWQETLSNVTANLVNNFKTDGVYLDQIASAGPRPCWDASHGHTLGGGNHWVTGYRKLMQDARAKGMDKTKIYLTESNAEPFMDVMTVYLTLVGFTVAPFEGERQIVNIFNAIYGGYYYQMGSMFYQTDFVPSPDVFSSKIAKQFLYGGLLGWFSLGGRDNQHPYMGIIDELLDAQYDPEIAYLRALSSARMLATDYFVHGRTSRDLVLTHNSLLASFPSALRSAQRKMGGHEAREERGVSYHHVMSSTWLSAGEKSLLVIVTNVARAKDSYTYSFELQPQRYGVKAPAGAAFTLSDFRTGKVVAKSAGGKIAYNSAIASHAIHMWVIKQA